MWQRVLVRVRAVKRAIARKSCAFFSLNLKSIFKAIVYEWFCVMFNVTVMDVYTSSPKRLRILQLKILARFVTINYQWMWIWRLTSTKTDLTDVCVDEKGRFNVQNEFNHRFTSYFILLNTQEQKIDDTFLLQVESLTIQAQYQGPQRGRPVISW